MKKLNYGSILCILAYLALACFSCFWTAESLFIWQPSLTRAGAWLIAIVFYAIASISFSKVIKGFEKNTVFKHGLFASRGGHLFFGLIGLLFFLELIIAFFFFLLPSYLTFCYQILTEQILKN